MSSKGIYLTLLIGRTDPKPANKELAEALQSVEVTLNDKERSGFQLAFQTASNGVRGIDEIQSFSRVILMVTLGAVQQVLMDGIIAHKQLMPGREPGTATLTATGEDVSIMMDLEEKRAPHVGQHEVDIAKLIIAKYSQFGLSEDVRDPPNAVRPDVNRWTPRQNMTDQEYLEGMASRYGYVFYVYAGPQPKQNKAYWGPRPNLDKTPQRTLNVNLGPHSNVENISFQYNARAPTRVIGQVQDRETNETTNIDVSSSQRPQISGQPAISSQSHVRTMMLPYHGSDARQALIRAQGMTDSSVDETVTANGELNALRYALQYGDFLRPRELVDLRGAGHGFDGKWYVKSVTHNIQRGEYRQRFTLNRDGMEPNSPRVQ